jgi:hypothetical protein
MAPTTSLLKEGDTLRAMGEKFAATPFLDVHEAFISWRPECFITIKDLAGLNDLPVGALPSGV